MSEYWIEYLIVISASLLGACLIVTFYSLGLRIRDGEERWRRPLAVFMFALCGVAVLIGIVLIVPALRSTVLG